MNFKICHLEWYIENNWTVDMNSDRAKDGVGDNKLRTYSLFKQNFGPEGYLKD